MEGDSGEMQGQILLLMLSISSMYCKHAVNVSVIDFRGQGEGEEYAERGWKRQAGEELAH